jgi:hypothetical protein
VSGTVFTSYYTRPTATLSRNLLRNFDDSPNTNQSFISNQSNPPKYTYQSPNPEASNVLNPRLDFSFAT